MYLFMDLSGLLSGSKAKGEGIPGNILKPTPFQNILEMKPAPGLKRFTGIGLIAIEKILRC
jgi:hypothetical protein